MSAWGTSRKQVAFNIVSLIIVSIAIIIPQWYLQVTQVNLDWTAVFWAVIFPAILAVMLFSLGRNWVFLLGFFAYIWALTEDRPVFLDSIFTWPEVTYGFQHYFLEVIVHVLTFAFIAAALWEALREARKLGKSITMKKIVMVAILGLAAFIIAYAQNLPITSLEIAKDYFWFRLDIEEHILSLVAFSLAIVAAFS